MTPLCCLRGVEKKIGVLDMKEERNIKIFWKRRAVKIRKYQDGKCIEEDEHVFYKNSDSRERTASGYKYDPIEVEIPGFGECKLKLETVHDCYEPDFVSACCMITYRLTINGELEIKRGHEHCVESNWSGSMCSYADSCGWTTYKDITDKFDELDGVAE